MFNNYSTTNNNYNMNAMQFQTHFMQYDRPRLACIYGCIHEVHAMTVAHTARYDEKRNETIVQTFRIPMIGPELKDFGPYDSDVTALDFFFFPQGRLDATTFHKFVDSLKQHSNIEDGMTDLFRHQLTPSYNFTELPVVVYREKDGIGICCDWFRLTIETSENMPVNPTDMTALCALADAFHARFQFKPHKPTNDADISVAKELQRLTDIFRSDNLYCYNTVGFDGEYCYSEELGKIEMSPDDFFKKFPDARPVYNKVFEKLYEQAFGKSNV